MVNASSDPEVPLSESLVRRLLEQQHPDLASLPISLLNNGWDNNIYKLGTEYTVRMPRRQVAAVLVENEQRWLPEIAPRLNIAISTPVRVGVPNDDYPWHWSVVPYFEGVIAAEAELASRTTEARRLGEFLAALHQPAPSEAPHNPYRGHAFAENSASIEKRLPQVVPMFPERGIEWRKVKKTRDAAMNASVWSGPPVWLHGDMHSANVLANNGVINAVIDFGDITSGDPATDLAIAWMLFDANDRNELADSYVTHGGTLDKDTWIRARGWAFHFALAYLASSDGESTMTRIGWEILAAISS